MNFVSKDINYPNNRKTKFRFIGTLKKNYVLYCVVLYCIVLYCIVLYCIVLYCIVLETKIIFMLHLLNQMILQISFYHVCAKEF